MHIKCIEKKVQIPHNFHNLKRNFGRENATVILLPNSLPLLING